MNRIRELRKQKRIPASKLAEMLGVTPKHLYDLEIGKRRLHEDAIRELSQFFGVTTDYLLGHVDSPDYVVDTENTVESLLGKINDTISLIEKLESKPGVKNQELLQRTLEKLHGVAAALESELSGLTKDLTPDEIAEIERFIEFIKSKRR